MTCPCSPVPHRISETCVFKQKLLRVCPIHKCLTIVVSLAFSKVSITWLRFNSDFTVEISNYIHLHPALFCHLCTGNCVIKILEEMYVFLHRRCCWSVNDNKTRFLVFSTFGMAKSASPTLSDSLLYCVIYGSRHFKKQQILFHRDDRPFAQNSRADAGRLSFCPKAP